MDMVKVAKDYFVSSQNTLLLPNRDFGQRKYIHIGSNGTSGGGSKLSDSGNTSSRRSTVGKPSVLSPSSFKLGSSGSSSGSVRTQGVATSRPTAFAKWVQSHQTSQKDTSSTQGSGMKSCKYIHFVARFVSTIRCTYLFIYICPRFGCRCTVQM